MSHKATKFTTERLDSIGGFDEIHDVLDQLLDEEPDQPPAAEPQPHEPAGRQPGECPECEHCAERRWAREQNQYRIGELCASKRHSWGREYFRVTGFSGEGYVLGIIAGVGLSDHERRWHGDHYRGHVGRPIACHPTDIERRLTQDQWDALQRAGWPLAIAETLRKGRVSVVPPPSPAVALPSTREVPAR